MKKKARKPISRRSLSETKRPDVPEITRDDAVILTFLARLPEDKRNEKVKAYKHLLSNYGQEVAFALAKMVEDLSFPLSHTARLHAEWLDKENQSPAASPA